MAVIGSVCKRTIRLIDHEVDSAELKGYLGILNCLYGASESLQHQALDSVYDLVESQRHPEVVLHKILDIMWYDGYISRQVILSWFVNKRKTCVMRMQGKDLGEQLQERMRDRQEVRRWMRDTTKMSYYWWYDLPHYQRVVLHALCQLAVAWQGDKCTVDRDLVLHYIPRLFCSTRYGLQLLYAVQCVLHHLQNPPGLAVAVLQALLTILTITRPDTNRKHVITTTDWDKWRNTQNPLHEEGRKYIQQQGKLLDLMIQIRSGQTLTEINGWISANIPQDQIQDAFIIAAECLVKRGAEVTVIWDWISLNLPQRMQTVVQDALQTVIIQQIPSRANSGLISWMDRHILPAWRQDAQFVRAAIKTVTTTNLDDKIDCTKLQRYLAALNCLYGAPEALQLQALESVYDQVTTLQNPVKVLQEVLEIMWYDGYISRQVIVSWLHDMDETSAIRTKSLQMDSKKDLREQLQERMRARQEVRGWMGDTTQLDWNYSPHYQRVTLHALSQLAVTWQGDMCTVDKELIYHYIPQLYCDTMYGLQLLYAVQCVLHHLQNPPGLAVAVLQALLTISRRDTADKPVITTADWKKWRNTQNPLYGEGRNIIQQQGKLLDLIVLINSGQTLTEINGWISANIQQDQLQDAFIITVECLINRWDKMTLIWDWISQNVPQSMQSAVQDTLQTIIIPNIVSASTDPRLISWMDRHILPAWRQDAQFVRVAIKAVCEKTMYLDGVISSSGLRRYLGGLHGAPEALQLQALESVYDHVTTLQHPEKVLQEVLDIMWYDGYISRQVIVSWLHNMDETSAIRPKRILIHNKKDLGEQIQERMRTRQEVRWWMPDTIQLDWNDSPHYQRVALCALCHLAVTWQGVKCTVDKGLLFHYIPQLFSDVEDEIQLLYAVQCVVYQLHNPPGLAESVLKALVSPTPYSPKPTITESHLEEWRQTKHSLYEEGREILLQAAKHIHR